MEEIKNCVYCHNECELSNPKCGRGEKMAAEVAAGTWTGEDLKEENKEGHREHGRDGHHGEGHPHGHHGHGRHGEHREHGDHVAHHTEGEDV